MPRSARCPVRFVCVPTRDEMLTIRPHPSRCMSGIAPRHMRNVPVRLTSIVRRHKPSDIDGDTRSLSAVEAQNPGIVHQNVQPSERIARCWYRRMPRMPRRNVKVHGASFMARRREFSARGGRSRHLRR